MVGRTSIVAANIAVTLTAGSADIDLSSATIPRNYQGHIIRVWDANNKKIEGFVGGNGTGTVQKVYSTKALTTQSWAAQMAGFDDTTNCIYEIVKVYNAVVVASGSIALYAAQLSLVNGTAFANPSGLDLSPYGDGRHILALYNTSGNYAAIGFIKAAGTGETTSAELIVNGDFSSSTGWTLEDAAVTISDGVCSFSGAQPDSRGVTRGALSSPIGKLYKINLSITRTAGSGTILCTLGGYDYTANSATGIVNKYLNVISSSANNNSYYRSYSSFVGTVDNASVVQVLTPSATGVTIVNSKGGTTYNWLYKHSNFNSNLAMTYKVLFVGD